MESYYISRTVIYPCNYCKKCNYNYEPQTENLFPSTRHLMHLVLGMDECM